MKEIAKVLTNALVEVYLQNSKYETETIKKKTRYTCSVE